MLSLMSLPGLHGKKLSLTSIRFTGSRCITSCLRVSWLLYLRSRAGHDVLLILLCPRLRAAVDWRLLTHWLAAGYLPSSGGLLALQDRLAAGAARQDTLESSHASSSHAAAAAAATPAPAQNGAAPQGAHANGAAPARRWWRHCDGSVSCPQQSYAYHGRLYSVTQTVSLSDIYTNQQQ